MKICYLACAKHNSDFEMSEEMFTDMMKKWPWEVFRFDNKEYILWLFDYYLPGLPEEIPLLIFKTKLSEVEKIPKKLPDKINDNDLVKYMLNMIQLIMEQKLDYESLRYDLLLKHFFNQDILIGVDSREEHAFVKKTIWNHVLPRGSTDPPYVNLRKSTVVDSELISEIIYKYKQPAQFSDGSKNPDEIKPKVLEYYSYFQLEITD